MCSVPYTSAQHVVGPQDAEVARLVAAAARLAVTGGGGGRGGGGAGGGGRGKGSRAPLFYRVLGVSQDATAEQARPVVVVTQLLPETVCCVTTRLLGVRVYDLGFSPAFNRVGKEYYSTIVESWMIIS